MKNPSPIHLTTDAEFASQGWAFVARDRDGHAVSICDGSEQDSLREYAEAGLTVTDLRSASPTSPQVAVGQAVKPDDDIIQFMAGVVGIVEANSNEQYYLWQDRHERQKWEGRNDGRFLTIGKLADMPVTLSLQTATVDGRKLLFVDSPSQVVDHRMIDAWLEEHVPATARRPDGRPNRTDAQNFHNVCPVSAPAATLPNQAALVKERDEAQRKAGLLDKALEQLESTEGQLEKAESERDTAVRALLEAEKEMLLLLEEDCTARDMEYVAQRALTTIRKITSDAGDSA